ncbi:MAG: DHH family phosphoesterase [Candidatus Micrarchaeota archaeon]
MEAAEAAGEACLSLKRPLVVHHIDCDGLAAGAAVAWALERSGKAVVAYDEKQLSEEALGRAAALAREKECDGIVFADFGSGMIGAVEGLANEFTMVVIDHHKLEKPASGAVTHINCEEFGFSGTDSACAASTAYFCFRRRFPDLAQLGIVGAVGDMQDRKGFKDLNSLLLKEAVENGFCRVLRDLRMFGRNSRPLVGFLAYSSEPFVPGLSGDEKACALFLQANGVPLKDEAGNWLHYWDLAPELKKKFVGAFVNHCIEKNLAPEVVESLVGDVYVFPSEDQHSEVFDALEYSTLLNACGRHGHADVGRRVCMKKPGALEEGRALLNEHRVALRNGLFFARKNHVDLGAFYFLDCRGEVSDTVIGVVAGSFLGSGLVERSKPAVAFALDDKGDTKVSTRGTLGLVAKGLDLDAALREAVGGIGFGGGHKVAAGATIQKNRESEFLKRLKTALEKQGFSKGVQH